MPELKTKPTEISVANFLADAEPKVRRVEGRACNSLFHRATGYRPQIWGPGFSPGKAGILLYMLPGDGEISGLLDRLSKQRQKRYIYQTIIR